MIKKAVAFNMTNDLLENIYYSPIIVSKHVPIILAFLPLSKYEGPKESIQFCLKKHYAVGRNTAIFFTEEIMIVVKMF